MLTLGALMGFSLLFGTASLSLGNVAVSQPIVASVEPSHTVTVTAYNAVPEQTDSDPLETASGAYSNPEIVAARSKDLADDLPFGTIIELDGSNISSKGTCGFGVVAPRVGYRVIADTMNARYTDRIDILLSAQSEYVRNDGSVENIAGVFGICKGVIIRVVGHVVISHMPKTQAELAALVKGTTEMLAIN